MAALTGSETLPRGVELRRARPADAEAGARLHLACWRESYTGMVDPGLLEARLADPQSWVQGWRGQAGRAPRLLAVHDGALVGFAAAGPAREDPAPAPLELYAAYVRAAWFGTGLGQALVQAVLGAAPAYLWVLEANTRARAFYEKLGFSADGVRGRYDPLDAWEIRMARGSMRP